MTEIAVNKLTDENKFELFRSVQSATTSRDGGMRMTPGRGRGHLCWWPLIFKKNFR